MIFLNHYIIISLYPYNLIPLYDDNIISLWYSISVFLEKHVNVFFAETTPYYISRVFWYVVTCAVFVRCLMFFVAWNSSWEVFGDDSRILGMQRYPWLLGHLGGATEQVKGETDNM